MILFFSCTHVVQNCTVLQYTVIDILVGRAIPEMNFGRQGGWLEGEARRSATAKVAPGHSPRQARVQPVRAGRRGPLVPKLRKQVAQQFKNSSANRGTIMTPLWQMSYFILIMTLLSHYYGHYCFYKSLTIMTYYDNIPKKYFIALMTFLLWTFRIFYDTYFYYDSIISLVASWTIMTLIT